VIGRWARHAHAPRHGRDDDGFTLIEVMVGAALMSVVMAIATGGIATMYHVSDVTEANATTEANLMLAFSKLDRDVRYAYRINAPYMSDANTYAIDYVIPDNANVLQCVQLRLPVTGGPLTRRQWPQTKNSADPATITGGIATDLATNATVTGTTTPVSPFTLVASLQQNSNFDRLKINVKSTVGVTAQGAVRAYTLQFTALNTVKLSTNLTCTKA
jgi:prepilin-type N-terminal cleavage/methylation domain-containing protein